MGNTQASGEAGRVNRGPAPSIPQRNSKSAVRILVVGRRGSGKSTLIRMLVGDKGPRAIRHGAIVEQDITKEWKHPDLPFIIHDSNGVTGGQGKDEIELFLGKRQGPSKVQIIWYVFSALDNRVKNDDGLLEMLNKCGNEFQILLIMTHDKRAKAIGTGMAEKVIEDVLECICGHDKQRRSKLQESMVRVENNVCVDKGGEIAKEIFVDEEALSLVVKKTMLLVSDHEERIERAYENLISHNDYVKEHLKETFKEVRILVVGKTGAGKTTLIRMLLGDNGPQSIRHGAVGEQDITREWTHPNLPFNIHDSNGIDTSGERRLEDIKRFLGERQAYDKVVGNEFRGRVHAVWYVFSALDNRVQEDHGLLKTLASYGKELPLLLIMTHHKRATDIRNGTAEKVTKLVLDSISDNEKVGNETRRSRLRESMIRVENNVQVNRQGLIVKKVDVDKEALRLLVERTKALMQEDVWATWAACQAVSMKMKVEASVSLILQKRYHQWLATVFVGFIPGVHQGQMALIFATFTHGLAKIWCAYPNLEKAIVSCKCFRENRTRDVLSNLGRNMKAALALVSIGMTALVSTGILPIRVPVGATVLQLTIEYLKGILVLDDNIELATKLVEALTYIFTEPGRASSLLMSYGLLVLGAIMYAHVHDLSSVQPSSVDIYSQLFEEFLGSRWARQISDISEGYTSKLDAVTLLRDHDKQRLLLDVITFFQTLCEKNATTQRSS